MTKPPALSDPLRPLAPSDFTRLQFTAVVLVIVIGALNYVVPALFPGNIRTLDVLDVGSERSLPTWFSVINLFVAAAVTALLAARYRSNGVPHHFHWWALAAVMGAMSIDESAAIHERFVSHGAALASDLPQIATHGWIVVGAAVVLVVGTFFLPLLWRCEPGLRWQLVAAGTLFVFGAIVVEGFGAVSVHYGWLSRDDLLYDLRRIVEEGFEMGAIGLYNAAIYAEWVRARGLPG